MRLSIGSFFLLFLLLIACQGEQSHSIEELSNNANNQLELRVAQNMEREDYLQLFEQFQGLSVEEIQAQLTKQPISLQEASFGFYYLANAYAGANQMEQALQYHLLAAEQYYNPQSYLKLAEREYFLTKDFEKAFFYLHHALEIALEITGNNRSHPIAQNIKDKSQFLLQELEQLGAQRAFDREGVWARLKEIMPQVVEQFRELYEMEEMG